jgi:hypothetical protein
VYQWCEFKSRRGKNKNVFVFVPLLCLAEKTDSTMSTLYLYYHCALLRKHILPWVLCICNVTMPCWENIFYHEYSVFVVSLCLAEKTYSNMSTLYLYYHYALLRKHILTWVLCICSIILPCWENRFYHEYSVFVLSLCLAEKTYSNMSTLCSSTRKQLTNVLVWVSSVGLCLNRRNCPSLQRQLSMSGGLVFFQYGLVYHRYPLIVHGKVTNHWHDFPSTIYKSWIYY